MDNFGHPSGQRQHMGIVQDRGGGDQQLRVTQASVATLCCRVGEFHSQSSDDCTTYMFGTGVCYEPAKTTYQNEDNANGGEQKPSVVTEPILGLHSQEGTMPAAMMLGLFRTILLMDT
mmetsp:Transcript_99554/g.277122  ORF Transcript_99554/g.277122 Transcript_99554/m.277122 type:complete len:118 (+) Transcript_99554:953-1306(+)